MGRTFVNFEVMWLLVEVFFPQNLGGMALVDDTSKESAKLFSIKSHMSSLPTMHC